MRLIQFKLSVNGSVLEAKLNTKKSSEKACCLDMIPISTIKAIKELCEKALKKRGEK